jgi:hypothetical protein
VQAITARPFTPKHNLLITEGENVGTLDQYEASVGKIGRDNFPKLMR